MRIFKCRLPASKFDVVQLEILQNTLALHLNDRALMVHKVVNGKIFLERIIDAIETSLLQTGKIKRGFTQGFAGYGAGVDAASAHMRGALDDRDTLAEISSLRAGLFSSGTASDHK